MDRELKSLADRQEFWKALFEKKNLAPQLASLTTQRVDGSNKIMFIKQYGQMKVTVESGSTLGDNFQSDTFIVTVQFMRYSDSEKKLKTLSTYTKVLPANVVLRKYVNDSRLHPREIKMYNNFFKLLREINKDQLIPLDVPDVYYTHLEEMVQGGADGSGMCILLEDLKAEGYRMVDKMEGVDYRHCHMALTSLAHYHALTISAVRKWKDPETGELSNIEETAKFLVDEETMFDGEIVEIIRKFFVLIVEFLMESDRLDLIECVFENAMCIYETFQKDTLKSCGPLACILHGDYWNNNIMFKYSDETNIPVSLRMLDFQQSRIGHPLCDVLNFLYSSTMPVTRKKYMLTLLRYHFDMLTTDLRLLGVSLDNYTWEDFLADYKKRSLTWLIMGTMVVSMTQNTRVVTNLKDMDAEEKRKEPKPAEKVVKPPVSGESGMSEEKEEKKEKIKDIMQTPIPTNIKVLSDRIIDLIEEIKSLTITKTSSYPKSSGNPLTF